LFSPGLSYRQAFIINQILEDTMSREQWEFIKACQRAQDEAYAIGDLELALSWSELILDVLRQ